VRVLLDTNRYTDFCRGDAEPVEVLETAEEIYLPFIVVGELRAGFAVGRHGPENDRLLREFLLESGVRVLYADDQTTHHYAAIYRQLRQQGTPIPTNDMWIGAVAIQHSLLLYARDTHFDHLPQLARI
jgi:tRNA(fMet)-specific endonuclease VapC